MLILKKPQFNKYYIDFPAKKFTRVSEGHYIMIKDWYNKKTYFFKIFIGTFSYPKILKFKELCNKDKHFQLLSAERINFW